MKIYYNSKIAKLFTFIDGYKTIMLLLLQQRRVVCIAMILSLYLFDYLY